MTKNQKRTKTGQTKHDQKVLQRYNYYKNKGAWVKADLPGQAKPPKIKNKIPDIYARLNGKLLVEEIETPDTINTDKKQIEKLKEGTREKGGTFKVIKTK